MKKKCNICGGKGIDPRVIPSQDCEECNGTGFKEEEEDKDD